MSGSRASAGVMGSACSAPGAAGSALATCAIRNDQSPRPRTSANDAAQSAERRTAFGSGRERAERHEAPRAANGRQQFERNRARSGLTDASSTLLRLSSSAAASKIQFLRCVEVSQFAIAIACGLLHRSPPRETHNPQPITSGPQCVLLCESAGRESRRAFLRGALGAEVRSGAAPVSPPSCCFYGSPGRQRLPSAVSYCCSIRLSRQLINVDASR